MRKQLANYVVAQPAHMHQALRECTSIAALETEHGEALITLIDATQWGEPVKLALIENTLTDGSKTFDIEFGQKQVSVREQIIIDLLKAARAAKLELEQMHSHYHPKCSGGCPTIEAIQLLDNAIQGAVKP